MLRIETTIGGLSHRKVHSRPPDAVSVGGMWLYAAISRGKLSFVMILHDRDIIFNISLVRG